MQGAQTLLHKAAVQVQVTLGTNSVRMSRLVAVNMCLATTAELHSGL